jgi:hypothetical protein
MALADALGCMWSLSSLLSVPGFQSGADSSFPPSKVPPKAGADSRRSTNVDTLRNNAVPGEKATHDAAVAGTPASPPTAAMPFDPNQNSDVVFSAVTNLNTQLTTLTRQGSSQK